MGSWVSPEGSPPLCNCATRPRSFPFTLPCGICKANLIMDSTTGLKRVLLLLLDKPSLDCCSPLVNIQSSGKVELYNLAKNFCCFYGEMDFGRPIIPEMLPLKNFYSITYIRKKAQIMCSASEFLYLPPPKSSNRTLLAPQSPSSHPLLVIHMSP